MTSHDHDPLWAIARAVGKYQYLMWYMAVMLTIIVLVAIFGD